MIPSFGTAFPTSTDGSSGGEGFVDTLGVLPNTVTTSLDMRAALTPTLDLTAGVTHQRTGAGHLGEARVGLATDALRGTIFARGALDRSETPIFIPGARREAGFRLNYCLSPESGPQEVCLGGQFRHSFEGDGSFAGTGQAELRF